MIAVSSLVVHVFPGSLLSFCEPARLSALLAVLCLGTHSLVPYFPSVVVLTSSVAGLPPPPSWVTVLEFPCRRLAEPFQSDPLEVILLLFSQHPHAGLSKLQVSLPLSPLFSLSVVVLFWLLLRNICISIMSSLVSQFRATVPLFVFSAG